MTANARVLENLELAGNALCLDFANTINSRHGPVHDYLATYDDLMRWSAYVGAMPDGTRGRRNGTAGAAMMEALAHAHRLRDAIYAVFSAIAHGREPSSTDLGRLSDAYADSMAHATLVRSSGALLHFELGWPAGSMDRLDAPLWPIARSAGDLLLAGPLERIGECPGCGWLYLDTSRNGTRRWCSMATCGSRDKMARYHRRSRA